MSPTKASLQADVESVGRISFLPLLLEVICRTTGLGYTAVARVTPERWIACSVRDEIQFGLGPGGELPVQTTICHEIRQHGRPVVIDHVAFDADYCRHHTPARYQFESYISMPIRLTDGSFFGTLCAIDPSPAAVNTPHIVDMFRTFAALISCRLQAAKEASADELRCFDNQVSALLTGLLHTATANQDAGQSLDPAGRIGEAIKSVSRLIRESQYAPVV